MRVMTGPTSEKWFRDSTILEDVISTVVVVIVGFIAISAFGRIMLLILNYKSGGLIYNFVVGLGLVSSVAFISAAIQEITERTTGDK